MPRVCKDLPAYCSAAVTAFKVHRGLALALASLANSAAGQLASALAAFTQCYKVTRYLSPTRFPKRPRGVRDKKQRKLNQQFLKSSL